MIGDAVVVVVVDVVIIDFVVVIVDIVVLEWKLDCCSGIMLLL